jgi:hypothetical protein
MRSDGVAGAAVATAADGSAALSADLAAGLAEAAPDTYFCLISSAFSPARAITPTSAPTGPLCPSLRTAYASTPPSKVSIGIVALSVSISAISSPALTLSPSFLSHLTRVPSVIVSESCGIVSSAGMESLPAKIVFGGSGGD